MRKNKKTDDAVELIDRWFSDLPGWSQMVTEEELKGRIGQLAYDLREEAGLTHEELAVKVSVGPEVIRSLEEADYDTAPFEVLLRICRVLRKNIQINCSGEGAGASCDIFLLSA